MIRNVLYYSMPLFLLAIVLLGESMVDLAANWANATPYGWAVLLIGAIGMIPVAIVWGQFFELESRRREWRKSLGNPTVIIPTAASFACGKTQAHRTRPVKKLFVFYGGLFSFWTG